MISVVWMCETVTDAQNQRLVQYLFPSRTVTYPRVVTSKTSNLCLLSLPSHVLSMRLKPLESPLRVLHIHSTQTIYDIGLDVPNKIPTLIIMSVNLRS